ncbi:MAG: hypothetical protein JRN67_01925, partial [Nitrososphaerota archaeon]|nr:hypothetical protein [Nitrososphaerota archaeon]
MESAVYQPLIDVNVSAEQQSGYSSSIFLPGLAASWTSSANGEVYNFSIRQGVTFSNGDPLNAYAIWADFYIQYYLSGNSSTFWNGLSIFNMSDVTFGPSTLSLFNQSGLTNPNSQLLSVMSNQTWPVFVTGPYALTMQMTGPFPFLLNTWVGFQGMVFDPTFVMQHGGPGTPTAFNPYFNLNAIPGTGPYVVTEAQESGFVKFAQNPTYWGKSLTKAQIAANPLLDPGHYSTIIVYDKQSDTSVYVDLTTNAAQIGLVTASNFQLLQQNPNYGFASYPHPAINAWMEMNNKMFPTNITLVRQAIVHAINYTDVIQTATGGYGTPFMGPEAPFYGKYYDPGNLPPYQYNVSLAEQDLASAGFPNGTGLPTMTLYVDSQGAVWQTPTAEIIQANLAAIGINVN